MPKLVPRRMLAKVRAVKIHLPRESDYNSASIGTQHPMGEKVLSRIKYSCGICKNKRMAENLPGCPARDRVLPGGITRRCVIERGS